MNYLDYFIIGVVVFYGLWGLSKGLLKIGLDFVGYIVAFFAAKLLSPFLVSYLTGTGLQVSIQNKLIETFDKIVPGISQSLSTLTLPSDMGTLLEQQPDLTTIFNSYPTLFGTLEKNMYALSGRAIFEAISAYVILVISVLLIFLVVKIVFSIVVSIILSRQDHMPLAFVNRLLGLAVGLTLSFVLLSFALQLSEVYALTSSPVISEAITTSTFGHLFKTVPLMEWLSKII